MKRMSLVAVAAVLGAGAPAWAADAGAGPARESKVPLSVALDIDTIWRLDDAYQSFASQRSGTDVGVTASYDVIRLFPRAVLALGLGWHTESLARGLPSGESAVDIRTLSLSGVLRWSLWSWLEPHARLALGSAWGTARLNINEPLEGSAWSPQASAGAGFRLRSKAVIRLARGFGLGFSAGAEGGFTVGGPMRLRLSRPEPDDEKLAKDRLAAAALDIGRLGRAHPYLRVSLAMLF